MTLNEKILGAMVVALMVVIVLMALSSCSDSVKAMKYDYHIAKCEKELVELREVDRLTFKEIGEKINRNPSAVQAPG